MSNKKIAIIGKKIYLNGKFLLGMPQMNYKRILKVGRLEIIERIEEYV